MKKIIFTLTVLAVFGSTVLPAYSAKPTNHDFTDNGGKKKLLSIGSSRASGDLHLRFIADKAGEATITILNESGKIVLQQSNRVANRINSIPVRHATELIGGSYTVILISNNETYSTRFMILK